MQAAVLNILYLTLQLQLIGTWWQLVSVTQVPFKFVCSSGGGRGRQREAVWAIRGVISANHLLNVCLACSDHLGHF